MKAAGKKNYSWGKLKRLRGTVNLLSPRCICDSLPVRYSTPCYIPQNTDMFCIQAKCTNSLANPDEVCVLFAVLIVSDVKAAPQPPTVGRSAAEAEAAVINEN